MKTASPIEKYRRKGVLVDTNLLIALLVGWRPGSVDSTNLGKILGGFGLLLLLGYAFTWIGLPDIWLGDLTRRGPFCFCHDYARYRDFSKPLFLSGRLDAVVRTDDAREALTAVFGKPYSKKPNWP